MSFRGRTFRPNAHTLPKLGEISERGHWGLKVFLLMTVMDMVAKENADYSPKAVAITC